jgi:hypothetical protein
MTKAMEVWRAARVRLGAMACAAFVLAAGFAPAAWAQLGGGSTGPSFKQAPNVEKAANAGSAHDPGMILGIIHENTLFFIAVAVIGAFWFLFGGGRKAKIGRKGH